jgi:hypothetical protein
LRFPHAELFFPVEPEKALVVHAKTLPPQQNMKPPVAKPPALTITIPDLSLLGCNVWW